MIDIKIEKELINKEVKLIEHEISTNPKNAYSYQFKLNDKLESLEKRGWELFHSEGMGRGGWNADKTLMQLKMMDLWSLYLNFAKKNQRIMRDE